MVMTHIPNEESNKLVQIATSGLTGHAASTTRLPGKLMVKKTRNMSRKPESTGGYDQLVTPRPERPSYSGTYEEDLTFETLAILSQYFLKAGATGTSDGNATPGYTYDKRPSFSMDDIASFDAELGVPGNGFVSDLLQLDDTTITVNTDDTDGVWKLSSNLYARSYDQLPGKLVDTTTAATTTLLTKTGATWTTNQYQGAWVFIMDGPCKGQVRQIASNTATALTLQGPLDGTPTATTAFKIAGMFTPGITIPSREAILTPGTQFFVDPYNPITPAVGTTQITDRIVSFSCQIANARKAKWFLENIDAPSRRSGRGMRVVTGQVVVEADRSDEWEDWANLKEICMRVKQTGSIINASPLTRKSAQVDIDRALWETPDESTRESNLIWTFGYVGFLANNLSPFHLVVKNKLATLP